MTKTAKILLFCGGLILSLMLCVSVTANIVLYIQLQNTLTAKNPPEMTPLYGTTTIPSPSIIGNVVNADDASTLTVNHGDIVEVSVTYKVSTGYSAYPPEYDETVFTLSGTSTRENGNGLMGGDSTTETYQFKANVTSSASVIKVGIYRPWEPDTSKIDQKVVTITVK